MKLRGGRASRQPSRRDIAASRRVSVAPDSATALASDSSQAFRRSRTIARRPSTESSERQVTHVLRAKRRKVVSGLLISLSVIAVLVGLLSQLSATVRVATPSGAMADQQLQERYAAVFTDYVRARPLERLRFMVDSAALHAHFLEKAPEVQSVRVVPGDALAASVLELSFRQPVLQWVSDGKRYYVDGQGVTFERYYFSEPAISVDDQSGVVPEAGHVVVNRRFLGFLGQVAARFEAGGAVVNRVVLPENTVRQVEFGIDGKSYVVRMTVDRGVEEQTDRALKAMSWLEGQGIAPSYVDARVDRNVFYK